MNHKLEDDLREAFVLHASGMPPKWVNGCAGPTTTRVRAVSHPG
jgi:tartrate dehydratase beta subunit/fumarate hydratase class I family protein